MKNNKPKTIEEFEREFDENFLDFPQTDDEARAYGGGFVVNYRQLNVTRVKQFIRTYLEDVLEYLEMEDFDEEIEVNKDELCSCEYNDDGELIGGCLRCVKREMREFWRGEKRIIKTLNQKIAEIRGEEIEE